MRTTIEIRDEHQARLLDLAARRGDKGFSRIIAEAIESYLNARGGEEERVRQALALRGVLSEARARGLLRRVQRLRASWR